MASSDDGGDDHIDITNLVRRCASQGLSFSHPFTPLSDGDGDNNNAHLKLPLTDLQDAMTALELGDKRMDCCEIPLVQDSTACLAAVNENGEESNQSPPNEQVTFPPRIAPTSLSDGVSCTTTASLPTTNTPLSTNLPPDVLLLPTPPYHSLLPHWNNLTLSSKSLLPLLILQLTALEAYIGTNNGGSNAAETLYCMLWCHDGVLVDMCERLGVNMSDDSFHDVSAGVARVEAENNNGGVWKNYSDDKQSNGDVLVNGGSAEEANCDELTAAQWALFASSLGVVRIAATTRWVVVNADFYEEEDFGVALHGEKAPLNNHNGEKKEEEDKVSDTTTTASDVGTSSTRDCLNTSSDEQTKTRGISTSMRFCPALKGSQFMEVVWDTALSYLRLYRTSCCRGKDMDLASIEALETILRLQQSFFQAIKVLSNLNDETVCDFTKIAVKRSRETVALLEKLRDNAVVAELSRAGLVDLNGRLLQQTIHNQPELNLLLSASFDPFVNRRLLGNAPVRKACFRRPLDVLASLSESAAELEWGVCDIILYGNTFGRIIRMLENNSLRGCGGAVPIAPKKEELESPTRKEDSEVKSPVGMNILSRSLVLLNLYFDDKLLGQYDFSDMIGE